MEDEDGYMVLGKRGAAGSPGPLQDAGSIMQDPQGDFAPPQARGPSGAPRCPRCLLGALTAALVLFLVLSLVVHLSWLVAERGQPEGTTGCGNASLGCIYLGLRKSLCPLRESEGCRLCPTGWVLRGTKCYWAADGINPWNKSREDCANRGAELMLPGDLDEDFLNKILQKPSRYFWIGLSLPSGGKGWTWLNGSRLDQSRFPLSPRDEGRACGMVQWGRIGSHNCSLELHWICQKEATHL